MMARPEPSRLPDPSTVNRAISNAASGDIAAAVARVAATRPEVGIINRALGLMAVARAAAARRVEETWVPALGAWDDVYGSPSQREVWLCRARGWSYPQPSVRIS